MSEIYQSLTGKAPHLRMDVKNGGGWYTTSAFT